MFVRLCFTFEIDQQLSSMLYLVSLQVKVQPKKTAKPVKEESSDDSSEESSDEVERH